MDSQVTFVGIGHKKQRGKDTFAALLRLYLQELRSATAADPEAEADAIRDYAGILPFALPLKLLAQLVYGLTEEQCFTEEGKNSQTNVTHGMLGGAVGADEPMTAREVLQILGVTLREALPGIWANAPFLLNYEDQVRFVIIPDVRFPDEAQRIKDSGGILIRVDRDTGVEDSHESETALDGFDDWDLIVDNNRGIEDLKQAVITAGQLAMRAAGECLLPEDQQDEI